MYIYSGHVRMGTVGQPTKFKDRHGRPLFVGDVVVLYYEGRPEDHLTAVVSEEWISYSNGEHIVREGPVEQFVMGIKSVDLETPDKWAVLKVKDHSDVINGEKWPQFGFNYQST